MKTVIIYRPLAAKPDEGFEGDYTLENILNGTVTRGTFAVVNNANGLYRLHLQVEDTEPLSGEAMILSLYDSRAHTDDHLLWRGIYDVSYRKPDGDPYEVYKHHRELIETNL